jgi:hypothetical protein
VSAWARRTSPTANDFGPGVGYGNGVFIATTYSGDVVRSADQGATWASVANFAGKDFNCAGYGDGVWLIGTFHNPSELYRSTDDGLTFTLVEDPPTVPSLVSLTSDGAGTWLALGAVAGPNNYAVSSDGGLTWTTPGIFNSVGGWNSAGIWDGSKFVALAARGDGTGVNTSADGQTWAETVLSEANFAYVAFDGSSYVIADTGNLIRHAGTPEGLQSATNVSTGLDAGGADTLGAGNGAMLVSDYAAGLALSDDLGATWTLQADMFDDAKNVNGVAYGNHTFIAVGDGGNIATYDQPSGAAVTGTLDVALDGVAISARGQSWYRRLARELHRVGFVTGSFTFQRMVRELRRVRYGNSVE